MSQKKSVKDFAKEAVDVMYEVGTFKSDLDTYIRSRIPAYAVNTNEEKRFIQYMDHFSKIRGLKLHVWDMISGLVSFDFPEDKDPIDLDNDKTRQCSSEHERILAYITNEYSNCQNQRVKECRLKKITGEVFILLDFGHMLNDPRIIRRLKMLSNVDFLMSIVLVGDYISTGMTNEMKEIIPALSAPLAGREELKTILQEMVGPVSEQLPDVVKEVEENEEAILKLIEGKTLIEAQYLLSGNLVACRSFLGKKDV